MEMKQHFFDGNSAALASNGKEEKIRAEIS